MSRKVVRDQTSLGHEIIGDTARSDARTNAPGTVSAKSQIIDDYCLYWKGPYGITSVDFFGREQFIEPKK